MGIDEVIRACVCASGPGRGPLPAVLIDVAGPTLGAGLRSVLVARGVPVVEAPDGDPVVITDRFDPPAAPRTVAVLADAGVLGLWTALAAGVRGAVLRDGPVEDLLHAVVQVGRGQAWLTPAFTPSLIEYLAAAPRPGADLALGELSARQHEVLTLMVRGLSTPQIATRLCITRSTVKMHIADVLRKLQVPSRAAAVALVTGHHVEPGRTSSIDRVHHGRPAR